MSKYEIMIILDPKADINKAKELFESVFTKTGITSFKKMDNTDLAYEINKSKTGIYVLANIETERENIAELRRKMNFTKWIWRELVINLDTEKGLNGKPFNSKFNKWKKRAPRVNSGDRRNYSRPPYRENNRRTTSTREKE